MTGLGKETPTRTTDNRLIVVTPVAPSPEQQGIDKVK